MTKNVRINFKVSEVEFKKIQAMKNGRTLSQYFRDLIKNAEEKEVKDANQFLKLLEKINSSDVVKLAEIVNRVEQVLDEQNVRIDRVEKYLKRILKESVRVNIAVEELAKRRLGRTDFYDQYLDEIERRLEEERGK